MTTLKADDTLIAFAITFRANGLGQTWTRYATCIDAARVEAHKVLAEEFGQGLYQMTGVTQVRDLTKLG